MIFEISSTDGELKFGKEYVEKLSNNFNLVYNQQFERHFIQINSIDELLKLRAIVDEELIIGVHSNAIVYIEIYDSWRE